MKLSRDFLKKIISEEVRNILQEELPIDNNYDVYVRYLKNLDLQTFEGLDSMSASIRLNLDNEGLSDSLKMKAIYEAFGENILTWPSVVRDVTAVLRTKYKEDTAGSESGPKSIDIPTSGRAGISCKHAVVVQKQAAETIKILAKDFGLDTQKQQKVLDRLDDGILGDTTLTIMKLLSNGQMSDKDYPTKNKNSYRKACRISKDTLKVILDNMKIKPDESTKTILKALGVEAETMVADTQASDTSVAESKKITFKKALKEAILRELRKKH